MLQNNIYGQEPKPVRAKYTLLLFLLSAFLLPGIVQGSEGVSPKNMPSIEGYTKGELEIRIATFGLDNPVTVGKVAADGVIHFSWPELDLGEVDEHGFFTTPLKKHNDLRFCKEPNIAFTNQEAKTVNVNYLYLYKYGQKVGDLIPSTQVGSEHRPDEVGSTIRWIYSDSAASVEAQCSVKREGENLYSFDETKTISFAFQKGWNLVSDTLVAVEEYENEGRKRSLPKTKTKRTIEEIPSDIVWHMKYTANDELLEFEQRLLKETPLTKQDYESWLPKTLGKLKRTGYEVGKEIERIDTDNNVNMLFAKGSKKIDLTIVDPAGSKDTVAMFTTMMDFASTDWKEETDTGYRSAAEMEGKRVLTDYNENESKANLQYNVHDRLMVRADAENMTPEELWKHLQALDFEALIGGHES